MDRVSLLAIEINAVTHCNLSCIACSHASPVSPPRFADPDIVRADLACLATVLSVKELRVLGGEPLLHPDLEGVLRAVRDSGIEGRIRVITNGTLLHATDWRWLDHADEVHVSQYPGACVRAYALCELERRCRESGIELVIKRYHSFRLVHPPAPLSIEETQDVFDTCQDAHAWSCHTVEDGYFYLCPTSASVGTVDQTERCPIRPVDGLAARLRTLLSRREPLRACRMCLGTVGVRIPHRQTQRKAWATLSRAGAIDRDRLEALRRDCWADIGCCDEECVVSAPQRSER